MYRVSVKVMPKPEVLDAQGRTLIDSLGDPSVKNCSIGKHIEFMLAESSKEKALEKAKAANSCEVLGPQTPRDISSKVGTNPITFKTAPSYTKMNLCNIHFHKNAEHKGPEFSTFKGEAKDGGYACNKSDSLTPEQLKPVTGACKGIQPGDTVEVHWVHSSCDITPGPTLGACLADTCTDPVLRVETQVFLLVNDSKAKDFSKYRYQEKINGFHQAKFLSSRNGAVQFLGSTTGPKYNNKTCSPYKVNWSVSPNCNTSVSYTHLTLPTKA